MVEVYQEILQAIGFSGSILNWVRWWNQFEVQSNRQAIPRFMVEMC
jgi:hypothetical protein